MKVNTLYSTLHFCIVTYMEGNKTPFYYAGYYKYNADGWCKPVLTTDFNESLKVSTEEEACKLRVNMNKPEWKVEGHVVSITEIINENS